jgi:hypothetical protein
MNDVWNDLLWLPRWPGPLFDPTISGLASLLVSCSFLAHTYYTMWNSTVVFSALSLGQELPLVIDIIATACPSTVCETLQVLPFQPECSQQGFVDSIICE